MSSEVKNIESQINELKPLIEKALSLNHDLNNPLAGILGYCEFLMEEGDNLTKEQISYLKQIAKCADRIQKAIIELSELKIKFSENVDINQFLETINQQK